MIRYFSFDEEDFMHLYRLDTETNEFWQMDHCWTGEGVWIKLGYGPIKFRRLIEISEEKAKRWEVGDDPNNTYPRKNK